MNQDGVSKDDVKIPESELGDQINTDFEDGKDLLVTIISAMGEEQVSSFESCFFRNRSLTLLGHLRQRSSQG